MSKINPIVLLLLSTVILLSSFILLKQSSIDLTQNNYSLDKFQLLSREYNGLKKSWDKKEDTEKLLNNIIKSLGIKDISKEVKNKKIIVKFKNNSLSKIDKFVNKILNNNFNILKLNITQNSVELEIRK